MQKPAEPYIEKFFSAWEHPYKRFESVIDAVLQPGHTLLDVGSWADSSCSSEYWNVVGAYRH